MIENLLIFAATLIVPSAIAFALAHYRPASRNLRNAAIGAAPVCLPFFGIAAWITATELIGCGETCEDASIMWAMALYIIGAITAVTGFGAGLIGDTFARNRAKAKAGED